MLVKMFGIAAALSVGGAAAVSSAQDLPAQGITTPSQAGSLQAAITSSSQVLVGPSYTSSDVVAGATLWNPFYDSVTPGSVQTPGSHVIDLRFGQEDDACWDGVGSGSTAGLRDCYDILVNNLKNYSLGEHGEGLDIIQSPIVGGWNGSTVKTTYSSLHLIQKSYTPGQHIIFDNQVYNYSVGDTLGQGLSMKCEGGANATADEGCEPINWEIAYGLDNLVGSLTAGGTGATSVTLSNTGTNLATAGAGRFLMDTSKMDPCSTTGAGGLTISSITGTGSAPVIMTLSGSSCAGGTVSTVTTTTSAVTSSNSLASTNLAVNNSAGFAVGDVVVVADPHSYETETITAIPDTTHITLGLRKDHLSGAYVAKGGSAGYVIALTADTFTATGQYAIFQMTSPAPQAWPVVYSDSNHLYVWIDGLGSYKAYVGQAATSSASDAFSLFPAAEVLDVSNGTGHPTNIETLAPNVVAWASGDMVDLPPYPYAKTPWGHHYYFKPFSTPMNEAGGWVWQYDGVWNSGDTGITVINNTPTSTYAKDGNSGLLSAPTAMFYKGQFDTGIVFDHNVYNGALRLQYDGGQTVAGIVTAVNNASGSDYFDYQNINKLFYLSANSGSSVYRFGASGLSQDYVSYAREYSGVTGNLGGSPVAAGACITSAISLSGVTTAMTAVASPTSYPGDAFSWDAYINAPSSVTGRICNRSSASATPVSTTLNIRALN